MHYNIELILDLFRIYLKDETDSANITAINSILLGFEAISGALFYVNPEGKYMFCLAGTNFPIELPEERWKDCMQNHSEKDSVFSFSGWAPPGFEKPVEHWISAALLPTGPVNGFVFLGKNSSKWNDEEIRLFSAVTGVITEIAGIRYEKSLEAISRRAAENELERTQKSMADFFESFHDMIYTMNDEGTVLSINHAGVRMFGFETASEIIGKPFSSFAVSPDAHDFFFKKIRSDGFVDDHEVILKRSDGTPFYCLETSYAVKNVDGSILSIHGLIKDITERINNERELWKMNLEYAELNMKLQQAQEIMIQHEKLASIGQLSAGIAHEINNPLGFIMSNQTMVKKYFEAIESMYRDIASWNDPRFASLASDKDLDYIFGEIPQLFKESDDGFARILRIISNLKGFARMDRNVNFELFDVNEGIESTLAVAWNELKYVADVAKKFGDIPKIYALGNEVNQVVLNILVNAGQAIASQKRSEKGHIDIETRQEESRVVILISDDGAGIPPDILSRIFDPFFTTKEPGKGTGLGLSISYDLIVGKHNGKLSVKSEVGKGTRFRIELPIEPVEIVSEPVPLP